MQAKKIPASGKIHTIKSLADSSQLLREDDLRWFIRTHQTDLEDLGIIWYIGHQGQIDRTSSSTTENPQPGGEGGEGMSADTLSWFPMYHGDYLRDTSDLSPTEHGIYLLLLFAFVARGPLPDDLNRLCRIAAGADPEDVRQMLQRYWVRTEDGWINGKMQRVLEIQTEKHQRRVEAGRKGGLSKSSNAKAMLQQCSTNQNQNQNQNQNHLKDSSPLSTEGKCPQQKLLDLYHAKLPMCPKVRSWTQTRQKYLKARWQENPDMDWWDEFLAYVSESRFLTGRASGNGDKPPFIADFEWILKPSNFAKIQEGKYHR